MVWAIPFIVTSGSIQSQHPGFVSRAKRSTPRLFISYSRPVFGYQEGVLEKVLAHLHELDSIEIALLGISDDRSSDPLRAIVDAIRDSSALVALAFRRNLIEEGTQRHVDPTGSVSLRSIRSEWLTSSYCHIEVALAYQLQLPLLILEETGVVPEGVLDRNSLADSIRTVDMTSTLSLNHNPVDVLCAQIDRFVDSLDLTPDPD